MAGLQRLRETFQTVDLAQAKAHDVHRSRYNKLHKDVVLKPSQLVLLYVPRYKPGKSRKSQRAWTGPHRVLDQPDPLHAKIVNLFTGKVQFVHVARLQLYFPQFDASIQPVDMASDYLGSEPLDRQEKQKMKATVNDQASSSLSPEVVDQIIQQDYHDDTVEQLKPAVPDVVQVPEADSAKEQGDIYNLEKLIARRKRGSTMHYRCKWQNFPNSHNSWEPRENLLISDDELAEISRKLPWR